MVEINESCIGKLARVNLGFIDGESKIIQGRIKAIHMDGDIHTTVVIEQQDGIPLYASSIQVEIYPGQ